MTAISTLTEFGLEREADGRLNSFLDNYELVSTGGSVPTADIESLA